MRRPCLTSLPYYNKQSCQSYLRRPPLPPLAYLQYVKAYFSYFKVVYWLNNRQMVFSTWEGVVLHMSMYRYTTYTSTLSVSQPQYLIRSFSIPTFTYLSQLHRLSSP